MPAPNKYRNIHRLNVNIEKDMLNEFRDLCWSEKKTLSDKINELIVETVEKKALGERNPIDVQYGIPEKKHLQVEEQLTIEQFIEKVRQIESSQVIGKLQGVLKQKQQHLRLKNRTSYFWMHKKEKAEKVTENVTSEEEYIYAAHNKLGENCVIVSGKIVDRIALYNDRIMVYVLPTGHFEFKIKQMEFKGKPDTVCLSED